MMRHVPSQSQLYGVDLPGTFGLSGPARSPTVSANAGLNDATALWLVGRSAAVATPSRRYLRTATNKDAAQNIFNRLRPSTRCDWSFRLHPISARRVGHSRA